MRVFLVVVFLFGFGNFAKSLDLDTAKVFLLGGNGNEVMYKAIPTNDTGFFMVGTTGSFGEYFTSVYAIKLDSLGNKVWSNTYGINQINYAYSALELPSGNKFICGYSYDSLDYNGTLYKIDAAGNLIFSKQIGGLDWDFVYDIKQLEENKLVLCGNTFSNSSSYGNGYIVCVDTLGNVLWENQFNNENYETYLKSVCVYNGSIYSVGKVKNGNIEKYIIYKFSSEGIEIAKHIDLSIDGVSEFNNCEFKINGNEILCVGNKGLIEIDNSTNPQTLMISFSTDLVPQQLELSGGVGIENGRHFTQLPNGEIVLVGLTNSFGSGGKGMLIYRFSEAIVYYNGASFGDIGDEEGFSVCTNKNNRILFCGKSNSYNVNGEDCYWVSMQSPFIVSEYTLNISKQVDILSPVSIENVGNIEMLELQVINNKIVFTLDKKFDFSVYNIEAKLLFTGDNFNNDISFLDSGIYFIKIRTKEISKAQKYFKIN
jgi:hypothetical protein